MRLKGIVVPIVTPFDEAGHVDTEALKNLCEFLIEKGVHGLYPCGTTGEAVLLTTEERKLIAKVVVGRQEESVFVHVKRPPPGSCGAGYMPWRWRTALPTVTPFYFGYSQEALISITRSWPWSRQITPCICTTSLCTGSDLRGIRAVPAEKYPNIIGIKTACPI